MIRESRYKPFSVTGPSLNGKENNSYRPLNTLNTLIKCKPLNQGYYFTIDDHKTYFKLVAKFRKIGKYLNRFPLKYGD